MIQQINKQTELKNMWSYTTQEHDWISSNPKKTFLEKILKVAEKMGTARVKRDIQFYKEELKVIYNVK
jgi:hypothetical protein|tara:strand:+ start:4282 stop:4485 length:204 start_codon:yes stop_codon:yes gene_type:complete